MSIMSAFYLVIGKNSAGSDLLLNISLSGGQLLKVDKSRAQRIGGSIENVMLNGNFAA